MSHTPRPTQAYQRKTGIREDKLKWLVSTVPGDVVDWRGAMLSVVVKKCEARLGVPRSPRLVALNSGVAVLVWDNGCKGLAGRVFNPGQAKNINDVTVAVERWEAWTKEQRESSGTKVSEVAEVFAVKQVTPADPQSDMPLEPPVADQQTGPVLTRRDCMVLEMKKKRESGGPAPNGL